MIQLGLLTEIKTGRLNANASVADGQYPFFTCSKETLRIDKYSFDGDYVLVAGNGDLNVKHYIGKFDAYQRTYAIKSNPEKLDSRYLFYFLSKYIDVLRNQSIGGVIKYIKIGNLTDARIPLPPLAEQKQFAAILDAADSLRQKDQQLVDHYTALSQSLFLEIFGDIFINPYRFDVKKLESLVKKKSDIVDGPFGSSIDTKVDYVDDGEIPVIRTRNISIDNNFVTDDLKFMRRSKYETVIRSQVLAGDIVLTKVGTIGNICIMPSIFKEAVLSTTGSCRIRADESIINKTYLLHYLNLYKPKMLETASAGVQAFLNMKHIKNFNVLCPPLELQNQFAERIAIIEQQKQQAQTNLQKSEALFNSLLQRAFTGELTADKAA